MILYLIRGAPGSGKSTFAQKLGCIVLENDMFCIENGVYSIKKNPNPSKKAVYSFTEQTLVLNCDVAVTGVFHTKKSLEPFLNLGEKYGATVKVIKMNGDFGNKHNVPIIAIRGFKKNWEDVEGEINENVQ